MLRLPLALARRIASCKKSETVILGFDAVPDMPEREYTMTHGQLVPVEDSESAIAAGWLIEVDGRQVAELTEPMYVSGSQFWFSYVIVPVTTNPPEQAQLLTAEFWSSGKAVFRSRKFGIVAPNALPSITPPCPDTHRLSVRGLHLQMEPGPGMAKKMAGFLKRLIG